MGKDYNSFVFTHIPKCGGTSFRSFINDAALKSEIPLDQIHIPGLNGLGNPKNLPQLSKEELAEVQKKELKIITDHTRFGEHQRLGVQLDKPFYYTMFREPVSRFISHYNFFYYKNNYNGLGGKTLNDLNEETLVALLEKLSNVQVNYVANVKMPKVVGAENVLKIAKYNLLFEYGCFGILEDVQASVELLKEKSPTWLKIEGDFPSKNINKAAIDLKQEVIEKIKYYNHLDIKLYNFALKIFKANTDVESSQNLQLNYY